MRYPVTPDGRYFVVRERLWRMSRPDLDPQERDRLVKTLMAARSALRSTPLDERAAVRAAIDTAKRALGERGPIWWDDGAPDHNRRMVRNTPYADWFTKLSSTQ